MKWIREPCTVKTRADRPIPYLLKWRDETWEVREVQEAWRKESKWWTETGPERRTYYRCTVHTGSASRGGNTVMELCLQEKRPREEQSPSRWFVSRIAD